MNVDIPNDILDIIISKLDILSLICIVSSCKEYHTNYKYKIDELLYMNPLKFMPLKQEYYNINFFMDDLLKDYQTQENIYRKYIKVQNMIKSSLIINKNETKYFFKINNNLIYNFQENTIDLQLKKKRKISYLFLYIGLKISMILYNMDIPKKLLDKLPDWFIHVLDKNYNGLLLKELMCGYLLL